jgi:hypothetical protein
VNSTLYPLHAKFEKAYDIPNIIEEVDSRRHYSCFVQETPKTDYK